MSDIKLFALDGGTAARELPGTAVALERSLQTLIERNLPALLGARFLASEFSTGPQHGGRIDSLAIDENGSPVIIEYKRSTNENVINQGLFYLDWLMDHKAEFRLLVTEKLGGQAANEIDWSAPRLLCIAGGFNKYDEHAVRQMNRNIELIRYRRFGEDLLLLELVNATSGSSTKGGDGASGTAEAGGRAVATKVAELQGPIRDVFEELRAYLLALGDDVQEIQRKLYIAYKRLKNFACVEAHFPSGEILVFLKINPEGRPLEPGFARDVREIGHFGTGDLELRLKTREDLDRAKPLIQESYEAS